MTEMHDVVEMLLERIKDYPEEFIDDPTAPYKDARDSKWKKALRLIGSVLAPHEKEALDTQLEAAKRAVYMGAALKTMVIDEVEEEVINSKYSHQTMGVGITAPTININTMAGIGTASQSAMVSSISAMADLSELPPRQY